MTKGAALQAFFSQFMDAYAASAVPEGVNFPYLTYELITSAWDGAPSTLAAPPATGFTGTISGRARRRPMPSPGNRARIKSFRQGERA